MKNSIKIIAITLFAYSNVIVASNANTITNDDKIKNAKLVTYADPKLIKSELGTLVGYSKTTQNKIADDAKIVDKTFTISEVDFVAYADENLADNELNFTTTTISADDKIIADASITENQTTNTKNFNFVAYADESLIHAEQAPLQRKVVTIAEKIKANNIVIESKISNYTFKLLKKGTAKKTTITINARKF